MKKIVVFLSLFIFFSGLPTHASLEEVPLMEEPQNPELKELMEGLEQDFRFYRALKKKYAPENEAFELLKWGDDRRKSFIFDPNEQDPFRKEVGPYIKAALETMRVVFQKQTLQTTADYQEATTFVFARHTFASMPLILPDQEKMLFDVMGNGNLQAMHVYALNCLCAQVNGVQLPPQMVARGIRMVALSMLWGSAPWLYQDHLVSLLLSAYPEHIQTILKFFSDEALQEDGWTSFDGDQTKRVNQLLKEVKENEALHKMPMPLSLFSLFRMCEVKIPSYALENLMHDMVKYGWFQLGSMRASYKDFLFENCCAGNALAQAEVVLCLKNMSLKMKVSQLEAFKAYDILIYDLMTDAYGLFPELTTLDQRLERIKTYVEATKFLIGDDSSDAYKKEWFEGGYVDAITFKVALRFQKNKDVLSLEQLLAFCQNPLTKAMILPNLSEALYTGKHQGKDIALSIEERLAIIEEQEIPAFGWLIGIKHLDFFKAGAQKGLHEFLDNSGNGKPQKLTASRKKRRLEYLQGLVK